MSYDQMSSSCPTSMTNRAPNVAPEVGQLAFAQLAQLLLPNFLPARRRKKMRCWARKHIPRRGCAPNFSSYLSDLLPKNRPNPKKPPTTRGQKTPPNAPAQPHPPTPRGTWRGSGRVRVFPSNRAPRADRGPLTVPSLFPLSPCFYFQRVPDQRINGNHSFQMGVSALLLAFSLSPHYCRTSCRAAPQGSAVGSSTIVTPSMPQTCGLRTCCRVNQGGKRG
jgi:hypothetical protein